MSENVATVVGTTLVTFVLGMLRAWWRFSHSPEGRVILRVLREAGLKAALQARAAFKDGLLKARTTDSAGGETVTPDERRALAKDTAKAFLKDLDVLGVLVQVAEALGGVEKLEADLSKRIEERIEKSSS